LKKLGFLLLIFAFMPLTTLNGLMIKIDVDTLWAESDAAILGTVTGIEAYSAARGMIYRTVTIQVEDHFILPSDKSTVRVRIEGGEIGDMGVWVEDQPEFHIGEKVFVFLSISEDTKEDYDYTVYGCFQGKFNANEGIATQITGESFTIPDPEDTMREDTIPSEENEQNEPEYNIDAFVTLASVIVLIATPLTLWSLSGKPITH
jgi:hypothetical protein